MTTSILCHDMPPFLSIIYYLSPHTFMLKFVTAWPKYCIWNLLFTWNCICKIFIQKCHAWRIFKKIRFHIPTSPWVMNAFRAMSNCHYFHGIVVMWIRFHDLWYKMVSDLKAQGKEKMKIWFLFIMLNILFWTRLLSTRIAFELRQNWCDFQMTTFTFG